MSKKLIIGLALAAVLISGPFIGARADYVSESCWAGFCPGGKGNVYDPRRDTDQPQRDMDKSNATCQGADRYGPTTPEPMGSPGV